MIRPVSGGIEIDLLVAPRASRDKVGSPHDGRLKISTTAPPVDGAANEAIEKLVAKALGVARSKVAVTRGMTSKRKTVLVLDFDAAIARERLL